MGGVGIKRRCGGDKAGRGWGEPGGWEWGRRERARPGTQPALRSALPDSPGLGKNKRSAGSLPPGSSCGAGREGGRAGRREGAGRRRAEGRQGRAGKGREGGGGVRRGRSRRAGRSPRAEPQRGAPQRGPTRRGAGGRFLPAGAPRERLHLRFELFPFLPPNPPPPLQPPPAPPSPFVWRRGKKK